MTRTTDEVLELERQFWTRADDPDHFRTSYADEGLTVLEPMGFIGKEQAVKMVADRPWNEVEMEDVEIREVTPGVVIVAYYGTGRRDGDEEPYRGSIASTYVRQDGRWQLALTAHQPWTPE